MKIALKLDANPIKYRPYILKPRIREKVKKEIDRMLVAGLDEGEWISPIFIQVKKDLKKKIRVCVDYRILKNSCIHDMFPTPFSDEVLDNVAGNEAYSFTDGFSNYHQVWIVEEDKKKTTFMTKWCSYAYNVVPFSLKNTLALFSRIVIATFRDYHHKFLEVYMEDWTIYSLLKKHSILLRVMFDHFRQIQIYLNLKSVFFLSPLEHCWVI